MYDTKSLIEKINGKYNGRLQLAGDGKSIAAGAGDLIRLSELLKNEYGYYLLADMTAVDYVDYYELVYNLMDMDANLLGIKVRLDRENAALPTLSSVWKAAGVQEREIYDLMGIIFEGHADLKRILCRDDFEGHPLRKDFKLNRVDRF